MRRLRQCGGVADIVLLGAGLVGRFVAVTLAADHAVTVVDVDTAALQAVQAETNGRVTVEATSALEVVGRADVQPAVWVNLLPGRVGDAVREPLMARGAAVVDLAFTAEEPPRLDALARRTGGRLVWDVGIAPGLSNLWVAELAGRGATLIDVVVGGIPAEPDAGWSYMAPFSPSDVVEEYTRPARIIEGGRVVTRPALSARRRLDVAGVGTLEAALTDGLRSLLDLQGLEVLHESTLRWPGHYDRWEALVRDGPPDLSELAAAWAFDADRPELTVLACSATTGEGTWRGTVLDRGRDGWSSMARCTGLVTVAAVEAAVAGEVSAGVHAPEHVRGLLERAEARLRAAGVRLERNDWPAGGD